MALDRIVHWRDCRPTTDAVQLLLEDFFNGAATITLRNDRWFCALPGTPKNPFRRAVPDIALPQACYREQRYIEVILDQNSIDIITRDQDPFVDGLAKRLQELFAQGWSGVCDPG
ncbi:hypothetical protein HY632_04630 [Candidatus Uhrbacteria bacterium]|nr:hypothetical protein [Candidatus Uhrbacteria bacterium]